MGKRLGRPPAEAVPDGDRRHQIIRVAQDLFRRRGYSAVSISELAAEIGVTKAALYNHFPSKEALYAATICDILERISLALERIIAEPASVQTRIRLMAETAILAIPGEADMDALMRDVEEQLSPEQKAEIAVAHRAVTGALTGLMREGVQNGELRGEPGFLAHAFHHLLSGYMGRRAQAAGFRPSRELAGTVVDLFLTGVANR